MAKRSKVVSIAKRGKAKTTKAAKPAKAARSAPSNKKSKRTSSARSSGSSRAAKHATPDDGVLPGFEQVRNTKLDRACKEIGDGLAMINAGRGIVEGWRSDALISMQEANIEAYTHRGVTLLRKHGAEKLEVKSEKGGGESKPRRSKPEPEEQPIVPGADNEAGDVLDEEAEDPNAELSLD